MSNLHSRPDSHLFERLHRTTVFLADALRPCRERADRMLHAWGDASHHPAGDAVYARPLVIRQGTRQNFTTQANTQSRHARIAVGAKAA
ncbi:hypothetical protein SAMN05446935_7690 [Burkholderia sp. YR290]|nr:hypothetical protein SAMN05446935_7690 [Burkholderia sp. YR290]